MATKQRRPPIRHTVDHGDVTAYATHIGDGYYSGVYRCRVCGPAADKEVTADKTRIDGYWSVWAQEHHHNP
jgi:hypothetical protein